MHAMLRSVCLGIALMLSLAGAAPAAEVIHNYDSVVQLAKDGTLTVTETLRVRAEGRAIRRGIYRDFPKTFTDAAGRERDVDFKLLDVTRDGRPEPHFVENHSRYLRIYAGDKDVTVATGDHTYVFRYRTARQVRWFDGKAELNWNVTGNFWNFPIERATYRLDLVPGARPLRWTAFTGPRGARGTDWRGAIDGAGRLTVETTRPLAAGEGLTVVAALPAEAVEPLSAQAEFWYSILDNRHWIFTGIGFVLVLVYYVAAWRAVGRDPKGGAIIPLFHPPDGVSPALANCIDNWGFGRNRWRAFTAAALSLAVRGLITFDQSDDKLILKFKADAPAGTSLPPGERTILDWVKGQGVAAVIDKAHGAAVAKVGDDFVGKIKSESKNRFFRRNLGYVLAGLGMTIAVIVGVLMSGGLRENDIGALAVLAFGSFFVGMFVVPIALALFGGSGPSLVRTVMSLAVLGIMLSISVSTIGGVVASGIGEAVPAIGRFIADYPFAFVLLPAFAVLNGLFFYLMRAPTALGRPIMDQLAGLRLYIETAEADRLNMQAPEITAERFEALLPYAVALNLEKPWSDAFAAALRRAHPGDDAAASHYQPGWNGGGAWSGRDFGSAVAASVVSASTALASAVPVSSSSSGFSSGGGGSGGGGGGGGGGGW